MIVPLNWVDGVQQLIQVAVTQGDHIYILGMNRITCFRQNRLVQVVETHCDHIYKLGMNWITGIQPNIKFSIRLNRLVQVAEIIVTPFIYKG